MDTKKGEEKKEPFFIKYFIVYPLLFIIGLIDFFIDFFSNGEDVLLPSNLESHTKQVNISNPNSPYRSSLISDIDRLKEDTNLYESFKKSVDKHGKLPTLGVRELKSIDDEIQDNGKVFKKHILGEYKWSSYEEAHKNVLNISNGLLKMGLKSNQNIVLFAETRKEWLLSALSCFRIKCPVVTLYATLGIEALEFGINQTSASFVFTSGDQLPKKKIKK